MTEFSAIDLHIPAEPRYAHMVRGAVSTFAHHQRIPEEDLEQFLTALGEALANALKHAGTPEPIQIRCWINGNRIIATVSDTGVGFPPPSSSLPAKLPHPLSEGGRGLPLMRRCSDMFAVRSVPGMGTTVLIGRRLRRGGTSLSECKRSA
jgi:anti-sigma regulatory factor (Ser/Thr protein kinase)